MSNTLKREENTISQNPPKMSVEQALQNLATVSGEVKATRQEHMVIQLSLQTIATFIRLHTNNEEVQEPDPE